MKKNKHQPFSEPATVGEPKISSTTLTLQQLKKEAEKEEEKKESAAEAARVRCRVCFKEIAPTRRCFGHGGGGGGDGGGSGNTSEETVSPDDDKSLTKSDQIVETTEELIGEFDSMGDSGGFDSEFQSDEKSFNSEIIAELIAKELLVIDNDRESMTLTIKLQCEPNSLSEEQRHELKKFMEAIIKEFNEFKAENHLSDDCMQIIKDEEGNILSLRITMPTLALYDAFIQRLANNLLPTPNPELQEKDAVRKSPNPLSMEPKPSNKDEEQEIFNPSPFNMKPW